MPGDVVFATARKCISFNFVPPRQWKYVVDEAELTPIHDERTKRKFDEGKYVRADIDGRPRDPALIKECGQRRYEAYIRRRQAPRAP